MGALFYNTCYMHLPFNSTITDDNDETMMIILPLIIIIIIIIITLAMKRRLWTDRMMS
jgi:hypothetical protein